MKHDWSLVPGRRHTYNIYECKNCSLKSCYYDETREIFLYDLGYGWIFEYIDCNEMILKQVLD